MKDTTSKKCMQLAVLILTGMTLLIAGLLIVQCAAIYLEGTSSQNLTETGVRIADIYSREIVEKRLASISWTIVPWLLSCAVTLILRARDPKQWKQLYSQPAGKHRQMNNQREMNNQRQMSNQQSDKPKSEKTHKVRWILYILAIALLIAGIANGGMRDVLVKATNICTECIGLG